MFCRFKRYLICYWHSFFFFWFAEAENCITFKKPKLRYTLEQRWPCQKCFIGARNFNCPLWEQRFKFTNLPAKQDGALLKMETLGMH